jgi:hypothetical protein
MYALARNVDKYKSRDKRIDKTQHIEYEFLAPDSVNELFDSLPILKRSAAQAWSKSKGKKIAEKDLLRTGERLLEKDPSQLEPLEILAAGFENSARKVEILKAPRAYNLFKELIVYYAMTQLMHWIRLNKIGSIEELIRSLPGNPKRNAWINLGGQLMPEMALKKLIRDIHSGKNGTWDDVHAFYKEQSETYGKQKTQHAFASLLELLNLTPAKFSAKIFVSLLQQTVATREWMVKNIFESRAKDYQNPFRQMVYNNRKEMDTVMGKLSDNPFINQQNKELAAFKKQAASLLKTFAPNLVK